MEKQTAHVLGFYASILTAVTTLITFGIAILTPPISGANCGDSCIVYPYLDIVSRFPRDYLWMYGALAMMLVTVIWVACIHHYAAEGKKIFSQIGLSLALMAAAILVVNYFVQVSVIQSSLENGETEGIPLLTQYNPHGIFIALEEIGYVIMSVAFLFLAPVFAGTNRVEKTIRWIFILSFLLVLAGLVAISISYGINRQDRFEVIVLSIDWLVLIVGGLLTGAVFRRAMGSPSQS
jgi:hypothetical protein